MSGNILWAYETIYFGVEILEVRSHCSNGFFIDVIDKFDYFAVGCKRKDKIIGLFVINAANIVLDSAPRGAFEKKSTMVLIILATKRLWLLS